MRCDAPECPQRGRFRPTRGQAAEGCQSPRTGHPRALWVCVCTQASARDCKRSLMGERIFIPKAKTDIIICLLILCAQNKHEGRKIILDFCKPHRYTGRTQAAVTRVARLLSEVAKCCVFYLASLLTEWGHFTFLFDERPSRRQKLPDA